MRSLIIGLVLLACGSDVHIMKQQQDPEETASIDTEPGDTLQDSNEPDTEDIEDEPLSDLTVAFAEMHFRQVACQACLGVSSEFQITAELRMHLPTGGDYTSHLPAVGTCTTNIYETTVGTTPLASTQTASFNSVSLFPAGQGIWSNTAMYEYQYQRSAPHTIITEHGTVPNAFTSLEGFDDIQPYTLLWVDPSYAFDTAISKSGTTFTWAPVVPDSQFEVIVAVYSHDGATFLGAVSCMENDIGYLTIPGSFIQPFPSHSITAVHLIRHRQSLVEAPELGGMVQTHMMWEVIGTGHVE